MQDISTPPAPALLLAPASVYPFLSSFFLSVQGILTICLLLCWGHCQCSLVLPSCCPVPLEFGLSDFSWVGTISFSDACAST